MTNEYIEVKCSACKKTSKQQEVFRHPTFITHNLDLKSNGQPKESIADSLNKCPYCHYTNYDISRNEKFEALYRILEKSEYKEIVNNESLSEDARKCMLMQYFSNFKGVCGYDKDESYKWAIRSSWALENIDEKKLSKKYKEKAVDIFFNSIFKKNLTVLIQAIDTARQTKKFDFSYKMANKTKELLELCDNLGEKEKLQIEVLNYIKELCVNKDSKEHKIRKTEIY